ncbi:hypothetical protein F529_00210 [Mycoplasmoides pneumoniae MAC]|uniref:DUF240 domain-containing protein n=1 Tax=Mycoplasmoides pneumoniae TaxID=2104 RepID=UPI0006A71A5B|nr:DUF240 domain-containing protein [Mycoplasmoides pneumoniae]ALA38376.1 hypothetical protein F529_00210 [Mycoplasmoides pneumoniae MAC]
MTKLPKLLLGLTFSVSLIPFSSLLITSTDVNKQPVPTALQRTGASAIHEGSFQTITLGQSLMEQIEQLQQFTPAQRFTQFKKKFPNQKLLSQSELSPVDVYNFLSGWQSALVSFLDRVIKLQGKVKEANEIFNPNVGDQIVLPKKENPNVLEVLGEYNGFGFFPTLGKNGLNLPQQIFENFTDFKVESYQINDFKVSLVGERDIIKNDKVRFSYAVQIPLNLELLVNNQKVTFNITVDLRTNNFSTQETFNDLFNNGTAPTNWQFFSRIKVNKLHYDQTDATHLANTLLQDQFNALNLDLQKSIYDLNLDGLEERFEEEYAKPLREKRTQQKKEWEEE